MQRRAQLAYDVQCVLASMTGTVPEKLVKTFDAAQLRKSVGGAEGLTEALQKSLKAQRIDMEGILNGTSEEMTVFLLDVEGTTTALPFVQKVLFPIIVQNLQQYSIEHYPKDPEMVACVKMAAGFSPQLKEAFTRDEKEGFVDEKTNTEVRGLFNAEMLAAMEQDKKLPYVKYLQGNIGAEACARHELETHVFADVQEFVKLMGDPNQERTRVAIYSSGSVLAQKMIMGNSQLGDLNPFISANLDPSAVGGKVMSSSYEKIRRHLASTYKKKRDDFRIVIVTDNPSEASAAEASEAVDCSILCIRPLNEWVTLDSFVAINLPYMCSFSQIISSAPVKLEDMVNDVKRCLSRYSRHTLAATGAL